MRFFFDQHLMQRSTISPEEITQHLTSAGLTTQLEQVILDLESLLEWGNLNKRRDQRRVTTLSEYARRRDLYFATPRGLSIEGFLEDGLDVREDTVISPMGVISGLQTRLAAIADLLSQGGADEEVELLWNEVYLAFSKLAAEVRGLSANLERKLLLEEREGFLEFKDVVRGFLERLSRELSVSGRRVRELLADFSLLEPMLLVVGRVRSGRLTISGTAVTQSATTARARQEFVAMQSWFARAAQDGDGLEFAIAALRGAVTRVLSFIDALHRTRELGLGRAGAFSSLAVSLADSDTLEARTILVQTLGLNAPLHAIGDALNQDTAAWSSALEAVELFAVSRGKIAARATAQLRQVSSEARAAASEAQLAFRERQKKLLALFETHGGTLSLDGLTLPDIESLHDLMGYLERAYMGVTAGPEGHLLEVKLQDTPAEVRGTDWTLMLERGAQLTLVGEA